MGINNIATLVTRPGEIGKSLSEQFGLSGYTSFYLPTLEIISQPIELPIEDYEIVIFISANAVKYSLISESFLSILPSECIAVGPGTAKVLKDFGINNITLPDQNNSEGMLALEQLNSVAGKQILIVKGRGGRTKLQDQLRKRGANCHLLDVYCRVARPVNATELLNFLNFEGTRFVTIASTQTLDSLTANLNSVKSENTNKQQLILVVASERIKIHAEKLDYSSIIVAKSATNEAMHQAILENVEGRTKENETKK